MLHVLAELDTPTRRRSLPAPCATNVLESQATATRAPHAATAMGHNKTQQKVLATLRGILRLVRATVDSRSATDPLARDVTPCVLGRGGERQRAKPVPRRAVPALVVLT